MKLERSKESLAIEDYSKTCQDSGFPEARIPRRQIKLLLFGPVSPPNGGATVLFEGLVDDLSKNPEIEVRLVKTSGGRGYATFFRVLFHLVFRMWRIDVVSFHGSTRSFLIYSNLIRFFTFVHNKPLIVRCFGGSLLRVYRESWLMKLMTDFLLCSNTIVLLEARLLVRYFRKTSGNQRIYWFPNSRTVPTRPPVRKERPVPFKFIFAGHIRPDKGILDLLKAAEILSGEPLIIEIYGGQLAEIEPGELNTHNVTYMGEVDSKRMSEVLAGADSLVLPTYYGGECYPGVIIEAFAAGKPVITTAWKFIPELVVNNVNGILVAPQNPHALASAMNKIASSHELYTRLCDGAYSSALRFDSSYWHNDFFGSIIVSAHQHHSSR